MSMWIILESIRSKKEVFCYRIGKSQKISSHSKISDKSRLYIVAAVFILFKNIDRTPCASSFNVVWRISNKREVMMKE